MALLGLYIGVGDFGKKLGLDLYDYILDNPSYGERVIKIFFCDLYSAENFYKELENKGIILRNLENASTVNLEAYRIPTKISYHMIKGRSSSEASSYIQAGVGKYWLKSLEYAADNFKDFYERLKIETSNLQGISFIALAGSGGGGTGCGTVPLWSKLLFKQIINIDRIIGDSMHLFAPVITVFPFYHQWGGISEPNTAGFIGRVWKHTKTIFVGDNALVLKNARTSEENAEKIVNKKLIGAISALFTPSISSPITRSLEAADYNKMFGIGDRASLTVPATAEFDIGFFEKWNIQMLLFITLTKHLIVGVDLNKTVKKVFTLITFPSTYKVREEKLYGVTDFLETLLFTEEKPEPPFIYYSPNLVNTIKVDIFLVDPYIPRLKNLYVKFKDILEEKSRLKGYIQTMIASAGDLSVPPDEIYAAEQKIEKAFKQYKDFLKLYLGGWGEGLSDIEKNNPGTHFFSIPFSGEYKNINYKKREKINLNVTVETNDIKWRGKIIEYNDRSGEEMLNTLLKILKENLGTKSEIEPSNLKTWIYMNGAWFPLTLNVLKLKLKDYPDIKYLKIVQKKPLWKTIICPFCKKDFKVLESDI